MNKISTLILTDLYLYSILFSSPYKDPSELLHKGQLEYKVSFESLHLSLLILLNLSMSIADSS